MPVVFGSTPNASTLAERLVCNEKVPGSIPGISTMTRTDNSRVKHAIRQRARRKYLDVLYARQNSLCYWCDSACVIVANIPEQDRVSVSNGFVTWRIGDKTLRARMATVDHLDPIRNGNSNVNSEDNLVMACIDCNKDRTKVTKIEHVCNRCGGALKSHQRGHCGACRIARTISWLKTNGWEEIPNADGDPTHTKFRDPQTGADHILRHACEILKGRPHRGDDTWVS